MTGVGCLQAGEGFSWDWLYWGECKHDLKESDKWTCSDSKELGFSVRQAVRGLFASKVELIALARAGLMRKGILPP